MKFRHECKHQINLSDMFLLRTRLSAVAQRDCHAGNDGTYAVKSLYFDNCSDKALREKQDGVNKREKFRIRYYETDTSFIRLEKKSKINGLCLKESCPITSDEVQKILDGNYSFMIKSEHNLMHELYAKIRFQLLRPKCIVAYRRESFVFAPGNVRVTLDFDIRGSNNTTNFLNPNQKLLKVYSHSVLEVKWDEYLPRIIRDSVQINSRRTNAFSKYAAVRL